MTQHLGAAMPHNGVAAITHNVGAAVIRAGGAVGPQNVGAGTAQATGATVTQHAGAAVTQNSGAAVLPPALLLLGIALLLVPTSTARVRLLSCVPRRSDPRRASGIRDLLGRWWPWEFLRSPWTAAIGSGGLVACWVCRTVGPFAGSLAGAVVAGFVWRAVRASGSPERADPLALAAGWDLLSAGMRAGLPVSVTLRAVSEEFTGSSGRVLREVADHLALGADPVSAWEPALAHPDTAELARAARRTARTGSGLAALSAELAARSRAAVDEQSQARAQRAGVWISAPLGLCFLPAFLCLGVLPVIIGMARGLTAIQ